VLTSVRFVAAIQDLTANAPGAPFVPPLR